MDLLQKLEILADAAKYDASCASSGTAKRSSAGEKTGIGSTEGMGICHAYAPDGRCISLLKILLTNSCVYDCLYCINRRSSNVQRARFTPEEVVTLTLGFYRRNCIEGLFLSSGIIRSPDLHDGAGRPRRQAAARGTRLPRLHPPQDHPGRLPRAPGRGRALRRSSQHQRRAADREQPGDPRAREGHGRASAAPWAACASASTRPRPKSARPPFRPCRPKHPDDRRRRPEQRPRHPRSQHQPLRQLRPPPGLLLRLQPDPGRLGRTAARRRHPSLREHRLYQADWLLRFYEFDAKELALDATGNLDLSMDPSSPGPCSIAISFRWTSTAPPREQLLRIPGLGVKSVDRLIQARRHRRPPHGRPRPPPPAAIEDRALRHRRPTISPVPSSTAPCSSSASPPNPSRPTSSREVRYDPRPPGRLGRLAHRRPQPGPRSRAARAGHLVRRRQPSDLFADGDRRAGTPPSAGTFTVPRALVSLAETVIQSQRPRALQPCSIA